MTVEQFYNLAKSVGESKENGFHNKIRVTIQVDKDELEDINRELYKQTNNGLGEYQDCDEIDIEMFGVEYKLVLDLD